MSQIDFKKLRRFSADIRIEMVKTIGRAGFGHIGGSASIADVLAVLYGGMMNVDPADPKKEDRDFLVLSKGHSAPALYAALALRGFIPMEALETLNQPGTNLPSHADCLKVPGIDISTGSLGQGMSSALGIAFGNRYKGLDNWTYCILGDGECNEGQVWEGAEAAANFNLDHFIVFVDWNKKQLDGWCEDIMKTNDLEAKFKAFGFEAETVKGYEVEDIWKAVERAKAVPGKPHCIILDTLKGLGIDFAEAEEFNHYLNFDLAKAEEAAKEIERRLEAGTYPWGEKK